MGDTQTQAQGDFAYLEQRRAIGEAAIIAETDVAGNITFVNDKFCEISGYARAELLGKNHRIVNSGAHPVEFFRVLWAAITERRTWCGDICNRARDGHLYWVHSTIVPILDEALGRPIRYEAISFDISARKQLEETLHMEMELIEVTLSSIGDAVLSTDREGRVIFLNQACETLTGWGAHEAVGQELAAVLHLLDEHTRQPLPSPLEPAIRQGGAVRSGAPALLLSRKGSESIIEHSVAPIHLRDGGLSGYVLVLHDVTEKHRLMRVARWQAGHDILTGLPNRALLNDRFDIAVAGAKRKGQLLAVCLLDLDDFKPVNDRLGHKAGDAVLVEVAKRLTRAVRGEDTVARVGGDEFVLLLGGMESVADARQVLSRILAEVAAPCPAGNELVSISASIGATLYPRDDADQDTLCRHADQAMYQAKQGGRNRFHLFDALQDQQAQTGRRQVELIRLALSAREFHLCYQPKVNMRSGRVIGMEALLRWRHPEQGEIQPLESLPMLEQTDLIVDIGEWVMHEALAQMTRWLATGKHWPVSVNIAAHHFQRADFVHRLAHILSNYPAVPARSLELEILESAALGDLQQVHDSIVACQALGVSVALDDFGTGYSSLTYLKRLPANTIKIDRSFVRDILHDKEDIALVEAIISLAIVFNNQVVAEGVETAEHGVLLMRLGCDVAQGYGIARPMPADQVPGWVEGFVPNPDWALWAGTRWELSDFPLLVAQHDHQQWVRNVLAAVSDEPLALSQGELLDVHQCRFGRWYDGPGKERYGHLPEFAVLDDIHARVHEIGPEILRLHKAGQADAVRRLSQELLQLKERIQEKLARLQRTVAGAL